MQAKTQALLWIASLLLLTSCAAQPTEAQARAFFRSMDSDGDDRISLVEYGEVNKRRAQQPGQPAFDQKEVELEYAILDADGDGYIGLEEWNDANDVLNESGVTMGIKLPEDPAPDGLQKLRVGIEIKNQGSKPLEGSRLWYTGRGFDTDRFYHVPNVQPGKSTVVPVELSSRWHMDIERIPEVIMFDLKEENNRRIAKTHSGVDLSWFTSALGPRVFDPQPFRLPRFNVLIFGPKGSGKSAFINSVHAMTQSYADGEAMRAFVPVHGGGDHCTVRYNAIEGMVGLPLAFWDTWGVAPGEYNGNELELIMQGKLPAGWEKDENVGLAEENDAATAEENRPHAVIFMLPAEWIYDSESNDMVKLKAEFTKIKRMGVNPLVLLARVDELEPTIRDDPSAPGETVQNARKKAAKLLGIGEGDVLPSVNYLEEHKKSFKVDRNLWIIVHRVLSQSKHYLEYLDQQAKQDAAKQKKGPPQIRVELYEAESRAKISEEKVTHLNLKVKQLEEKVKQLEEKKATLTSTLEQETAAKQDAQTSAERWRCLLLTSLLGGLLAFLILKPTVRSRIIAMLLLAVKGLGWLATIAERNLQAPPPAPAAAEAAEANATAAAPPTAVPTIEEIHEADVADLARTVGVVSRHEAEAGSSDHADAVSGGAQTSVESQVLVSREDLAE